MGGRADVGLGKVEVDVNVVDEGWGAAADAHFFVHAVAEPENGAEVRVGFSVVGGSGGGLWLVFWGRGDAVAA